MTTKAASMSKMPVTLCHLTQSLITEDLCL